MTNTITNNNGQITIIFENGMKWEGSFKQLNGIINTVNATDAEEAANNITSGH